MIDMIIYSTVSVDITLNRTPIFSNNGHHVTLIRVEDDFIVPESVEILSSGNCQNDCPFDKLDGDALVKYNLAYPRVETTIPEYYDAELGVTIPESVTIPPFKFGCIA